MRFLRRFSSMVAAVVLLSTGLLGLTQQAAQALPPPSWTAVTSPGFATGASFFTDALSGWVVGAGGKISHTLDGGASWTDQPTGTSANLLAITGSGFGCGPSGNDLCLWAAGTGGTIIHSGDAGATWCPQTTGVGSTIRDLTTRGP